MFWDFRDENNEFLPVMLKVVCYNFMNITGVLHGVTGSNVDPKDCTVLAFSCSLWYILAESMRMEDAYRKCLNVKHLREGWMAHLRTGAWSSFFGKILVLLRHHFCARATKGAKGWRGKGEKGQKYLTSQ